MPATAFQLEFDGAAADLDLYGNIEELEVEESVTGPSTFRLRVGLALDDSGQWSFLDDDRFRLFTRVSISLGFASAGDGSQAGLEPVIEGYLTQVSVHLGSNPGDAWLEASGMDASVLLALEEKAKAWPNMADSDIAQQVVSGYGFDVSTTDTSPVRQDTDVLVLQHGSDVQFVRQLAARNGYLFYFSRQHGDTDVSAYFGPPKLEDSPQADLAVQFGEDSNLVSFDLTVSGVRPLAVSAAQVDAKSKDTSRGEADDSQLTSLGKNGLSDLVRDRLDQLVTPLQNQAGMLLLAQPSADATELDAVAQAVRDQAEWLTTAAGEINSNAYGAVLRAGRLVLVKGAGSQHSGRYFVTRVTHLMGSDGSYRQTFEARRNARDLDGSEHFGGGPSLPGVPSTMG